MQLFEDFYFDNGTTRDDVSRLLHASNNHSSTVIKSISWHRWSRV